MNLRGMCVVFVEACGPIPKGTRALCLEDCGDNGIIRLWLSQTVYGVNEFAISRKHIKKVRVS